MEERIRNLETDFAENDGEELSRVYLLHVSG